MEFLKDKNNSYDYVSLEKYINNGDYNKALDVIISYGINNNIDVNIYIYLLNILLNNEVESINKVDNILGVYDINEYILTNYNLALNSINKKDYKKVLKHIKVCSKLIKKYKINIDLTLIEKLICKIILKENEIERNKNIKDLTNILFNNDNLGINYLCLNKLLNYDMNNINILTMLIECLINLADYNGAKRYLDYVIDIESDCNYKLTYLKYKLIALNKSNNKVREDFRNKKQIDILVENDNIDDALKLCYEYLKETKDQRYQYYAGIIAYNNNRLDDAIKFFNTYISTDFAFTKEVYYYLFYIYYELEQEDKYNYALKGILKLTEYKDIEINLEDLKKFALDYKDNFNECSIFEIEKKLLQNSVIGTKKMLLKDKLF